MKPVRLSCYPQISTDKQTPQGLYPVHIRIIFNSKFIKRVPTQVYVESKQWDKVKRTVKGQNAGALNKKIDKVWTPIKDLLLSLESKHEALTKDIILAALAGKKTDDLITFWQEYIDYIEKPRKSKDGEVMKFSENNIKKWRKELNRLKEYTGGSLPFSAITTKWLENYEAFCAERLDANTSLPVTMRLLFERLRDAQRNGLFDMTEVGGYKRPKYKHPERPYLTLEQTEKIWEWIEQGDFNQDAGMLKVACFFLVECYAGIRFSDWGKFTIEQIIDKQGLKVRTSKTGAPIYARIDKSPRLKKLIEFIQDNELVFDLSEPYANRCLKHIGGRLGLKFKLTTHVGRHTCATLLLEMGYSKDYIATYLGISLQTVEIYAKVTGAKMQREYEEKGGL